MLNELDIFIGQEDWRTYTNSVKIRQNYVTYFILSEYTNTGEMFKNFYRN